MDQRGFRNGVQSSNRRPRRTTDRCAACRHCLVYETIFSDTFASKTSQIWTTFTGVDLVIGGTVIEFLACCTVLLVKHPYDAGDRVTIDDNELIVEHISLMYSVFRRVDSDAKVQIPRNVANTLWRER